MYNRKEIKVRSTAKPKKDAFREDTIYSRDGLFNPFVDGQVRVPSNVITTHGMPGNVLAKVSDGRQVMMRPNQMYNFGPNVSYVDEEAQFSIGGGVQYMDIALDEDQIKAYKNGGYYIEELPNAQDGAQVQGSTPAEPVLTYAEYYAQTADAAKKAYEDYITQLEKEKQRVANVRGNVIPTAKKLDAADNAMLSKEWFDSPEGQQYFKYITANNPKQLEAARQALSPAVKGLLPNQGKYNVARWEADRNDWNAEADPGRELYCTPYGCFTYQKAGANDVPIVGGNLDFVQRVNSGALPFEKIPANQRQPGDVALWVENSPADYTDPSKGYTRRPHHTTIYASPDVNEPNNPEAGNYYNANNGVRLAYGLTNYETDKEAADRMDYYRYIGQTKKMEAELKKRQAAWEAAENKADRGPKPTLATLALDKSYFENATANTNNEITPTDYHQKAIDQINAMDVNPRKKRKLLQEAEDAKKMGEMFYQMRYPNSQPLEGPLANSQNGQIIQTTDQLQGFQDGGYYTYSGRPGSKYIKDNSGKWMIQNESTNGKFIPLNDPSGTRTKTLNAGATYVPAQSVTQSAPGTNIFANPQFMSSQQLQQKANNMAPYAEGTKWLEMAAAQKKNEEAQAAYKKQQAEQARYDKASGAGSSATNAPIYANKQVAPSNAPLPYVMSGVDDKGNATLITQDQASQVKQDVAKSQAFNKLLYDSRELEQVLGRKLTDKDLYTEEGQRNIEGMVGKYYNQDMLGKIEDQKQKNFEAANQRMYNNAAWYDKLGSTFSNLVSDPIITLGNWSEFKGTPYGMSIGLRNEMNPEQQARFREASNADDYWLNDYFNVINPFNHIASAGVNYQQGQYGNMVGNLASLIPLAGAPKVLGAASKVNSVKNIGKAIHTGMEVPLLRTILRPSTIGNPLLQTGENLLTKNILNANAGNLLTNYSRAAFPGAFYNYTQDPTAANFSEMMLLGLGTPEGMQVLNATGKGIEGTLNAGKNFLPYAKLYPKTVANIIKGDAPLSFSSFAKGDLVNSASGAKLAKQEADYAAYLSGDGPALSPTRGKWLTSAKNEDALVYAPESDLYRLKIPQTKGSAMSYNVQKQFANLQSKIANGQTLTLEEQAIVQGAERSLLPTAEFDKARQAGAYADLNLSDEMLNHIRTATENPSNYWELPAFKADPQLELAVKNIIKDPRFINKEEYLLDRLPRASEYKATTLPELQKELTSPMVDYAENAAAIKAAALDKATAERMVAANEQKIIQGKLAKAEDKNEKEENNQIGTKKLILNTLGRFRFQDGGTPELPITYIDQPNVYSAGNQRAFTPASAQALNSLNNQIAYEGELTEAKIAELRKNGFVVEDVNLRLPNNQQQHKPFELRPYGFVAGNNDGPVNNVIFGGGLNARFDTPLKQLAAGITLGATDVLGFDKNRVLYNDFRVNNPMFNLNYTIPYKKR